MISVIIPVYNGANTLGEQLNALEKQDYDGEWEIIVVNNRSTDNTTAFVESFQKQIPRLRLIQALEWPGAGYARNEGVAAARGDMLAFCDADDVADPGWLAALAKALPTHDFVAGRIDVERLNRCPSWRPSFAAYPHKPAMGFLPFVSGCNMALGRSAFTAAGGFDEAFLRGQDLELSWRLQLHGYAIHYEPEAVMYRRYRETLPELWRQVSAYATYYPLLYRRYAQHGMPPSRWRQAWPRYKWLLRHGRKLLSKSPKARGRWVYRAAVSWGLLVGSMRYRKLYL